MGDIKTEMNIYRGAYKAAIETVCLAVEAVGTVHGYKGSTIDGGLFEFVKGLKMKPEGRAAEFLNHFLYENGQNKYFDLSILLSEDHEIRNLIASKIAERVKNNPSLVGKNASGGNWLIPLKQRDFSNDDWRLALGSFPIEWQVVGGRDGGKAFFAKIWGANEYKWHPMADRVTQCLHKAGERLNKNKEVPSSNFWMIAKPCTILCPTGEVVKVPSR